MERRLVYSVSLSGVTVSGDVYLILADSAALAITGDFAGICVAYSGSNSLTIYGQADGTGTLTAIGDNAGLGGGFDGEYALRRADYRVRWFRGKNVIRGAGNYFGHHSEDRRLHGGFQPRRHA